ncbi:unnamed protein product [Symbiodinium sp. CCMP2592]|nr:unnamed protein product [Symbiodinium sp. CCMP2592]
MAQSSSREDDLLLDQADQWETKQNQKWMKTSRSTPRTDVGRVREVENQAEPEIEDISEYIQESLSLAKLDDKQESDDDLCERQESAVGRLNAKQEERLFTDKVKEEHPRVNAKDKRSMLRQKYFANSDF